MKAQIITIGDELLIGQTINTNAAFIGNLLIENQIKVLKTTVIGDDFDDIVNEFKYAFEKFDIIIVTGGLGPTHDDITLSAIVKFFDTELIESNYVLSDLTIRFTKLGRTLSASNRDQSLVPAIAEVIRNQFGTAPGSYIEQKGKIFISLPGVPHEMQAMMTGFVIPRLISKTKGNSTHTEILILQTTGIAESTLYEKLSPIDKLLQGAKLAFLPSAQGVKLRITVEEEKKDFALEKILEIEQKIRSLAGRYIYSRGEKSLAEVVGKLFIERGLTLAIAESCTGGYLGSSLTDFDGSSKFFERGVIAYSNASKVEFLHVSEDLIVREGAVSLPVVEEMAKGIRGSVASDIGLAITGIMGPTGGTELKPVGCVFVAVCDRERIFSKKFIFGENRILNKQRATQAALEMLRRFILNIQIDA